MSHKPNSQIEKLKPEMSHRQSYSSHGDKQNTKGRISSNALPKNIIDKNNGLLVNEINTFRLLFKIYEKLKKLYQNEHDLLSVLGQQVLKRVIGLKKHCEEVVGDFGLISIERYFDEKTNPSIKKYKSVIREYYRKYHQEIKVGTTFSGSLKMVMKDFL